MVTASGLDDRSWLGSRAVRCMAFALALGGLACASEDVPAAVPEASPSTTPTTPPAAVSTTDPAPSTSAPATNAPDTTASATTAPATSAPATTTPATTAPATTVPGSTVPATTAPPSPVSGAALVYAGSSGPGPWQRVGMWDGAKWVDLADDAASPPPASTQLGVASVDLPTALADVAYEAADWGCIDESEHPSVTPSVSIPESPLGWGYQAVAVTGDWPLQPRPVDPVGLDAAIYQDVGEAVLAGRPDLDPSDGDVVQVLRVDLDGNGTEEVLVSFRHLSEPNFGAVGDFSIVYLRVVEADGSVDDRIVFEHVVPEPTDPPYPAPGRASVAAVADLNGDGRMEVAVRSSYFESSRIDVHEFVDGSLDVVMSAACGV